jgi:hypothetical protein
MTSPSHSSKEKGALGSVLFIAAASSLIAFFICRPPFGQIHRRVKWSGYDQEKYMGSSFWPPAFSSRVVSRAAAFLHEISEKIMNPPTKRFSGIPYSSPEAG